MPQHHGWKREAESQGQNTTIPWPWHPVLKLQPLRARRALEGPLSGPLTRSTCMANQGHIAPEPSPLILYPCPVPLDSKDTSTPRICGNLERRREEIRAKDPKFLLCVQAVQPPHLTFLSVKWAYGRTTSRTVLQDKGDEVSQQSANLFCRGPDSNYFRLG